MGNHYKKKPEPREQEEIIIEYIEEEEPKKKKRSISRAVYTVGIIIVCMIVGLVVWNNRADLRPENIVAWVKVKFYGAGLGDGFPVQIIGSEVDGANFTHYGNDVVALSDTALTSLTMTAKQVYSTRHSFHSPSMKAAYGNYIVYSLAGTGYLLQRGMDVVLQADNERDIYAASVAQNGKFALGTLAPSFSQAEIYSRSGELQYYYTFDDAYITDIAMNSNGSRAAVATVESLDGKLVSRVTIIDFNKITPEAEFMTTGTMIMSIYWSESGYIYAVGDDSIYVASSSDYAFVNHDYEGKSLTAIYVQGDRCFISISSYEHIGASTMWTLYGKDDPVVSQSPERITSISAFGSNVAALAGGRVYLFDMYTGNLLLDINVDNDSKAVAMANESNVYTLGVSEIRLYPLR